MTRQEAKEAGLTAADLRWDQEHGYIKLITPTDFKTKKAPA